LQFSPLKSYFIQLRNGSTLLILLSGFLLLGQTSFSQAQDNREVDSLITILISLDKSPRKADILNQIAEASIKDDYILAMDYSQRSLLIAEELDYSEGIYQASMTLGKIYTYYYLDYIEAEHHYGQALTIAERVNSKELLLDVYYQYAYLMYSMENCNYAVNYYKKAIKIAEEFKDFDQLASLYSYIGEAYILCEDESMAKDYFSKSYALYDSHKLREISPAVEMNAGYYMRLNGDYDAAIEIYNKAITRFHEEGRVRFEAYAYSELARTKILSGDYFGAKEDVQTGLQIALKNQLTKERIDNYEVQIALYDSLGDYKKTYVSLIKYTRLKDSLNNSQIREQNRKFQSSYEEMMQRNQLEKMKEQEINHKLELENQRLNRNIIFGVLIFVLILTILLILRFVYIRKKERETRVLSLATSHSTNSIIIFDKKIQVEWVNRGFERLTGLSLDEVKGKYYLDFYNGPDLNAEQVEDLKNNFSSGKAFTMNLASFHRDSNEQYWISISVTPLYENQDLKGYVSVATDITELHEYQRQLEKTHDQTILLNEIGRQITSTLNVSEIIEKVYENVNKLMDAQNMGIGIYTAEDNSLFFPEPIEKGNKLNSFSYPMTNDNRMAIRCFKTNREFKVNSVEELEKIMEGHNPSPLAGEQPESIIYLPLISKWKTMGVISVQSFEKNAYGQKELDIVRSLATYTAIALENAQLYENMEDIVEERTKEVRAQKEQLELNYENIKLLSEIGVEIASSLDFEDVFERLYEGVAQMMDAEIFGVRIYHEDKQEIEYKYEIESGKRDPVMTVSMDDKDNYSVWCIENQKEILIGDNTQEYNQYVNEIKVPSGEMPTSLIFYPMLAEGRVFGVITVQSFKKNAYTPYHVAMVKTLSAYSAEALSNSELFNTLEHKVEERTKELAQKNKDIMSSINYARRIQHGILPTDNFMSSLLPDSFVLYRPRDIISGDFYWVERTPGKVFFAVVDCTGHGVPGALMSIIGKNILDQAVNEKEIDEPSMILTFLRAGLRVAFSADESEDGADVEDGMDLGVCVWDLDQRTLTFAGANNNLYLVHDGALEVIKGEKSGVSASDFDIKNYTSHEIELYPGDTVYLSSDGFPDQFGGERMKKYSQRRFQELLFKLSSLPMSQQKDKLQTELNDWMGEVDQLDDICVMGVKFDQLDQSELM
jgi:PAS domain S-box-containing protein